MKYGILILLFILAGCVMPDFLKKPTKEPVKTEESIVRPIMEAVADNITTPTGRIAQTLAKDWLYKVLVLLMVGGLIFWGVTRSHWGWIIPSASIAGISVMVFFAKYAEVVALLVLGLGLTVLIYKAWEYQRERNERTEIVKKNGLNKGE